MAKKDKAPKAASADPWATSSSSVRDSLVGASTPSARDDSSRFTTAEHVDELLLITPLEHVEAVETVNGTKEAIRADVVVLNADDPGGSDTYDDTLLFAGYIIGQLRPFVGKKKVVGTLYKDVAGQKRGQNAPYKLRAPSDQDIDLAAAYLNTLDPLR